MSHPHRPFHKRLCFLHLLPVSVGALPSRQHQRGLIRLQMAKCAIVHVSLSGLISLQLDRYLLICAFQCHHNARPCQDDQLYGSLIGFKRCDDCLAPVGSPMLFAMQDMAKDIFLGAQFYWDYDRLTSWYMSNPVPDTAPVLQMLLTVAPTA